MFTNPSILRCSIKCKLLSQQPVVRSDVSITTQMDNVAVLARSTKCPKRWMDPPSAQCDVRHQSVGFLCEILVRNEISWVDVCVPGKNRGRTSDLAKDPLLLPFVWTYLQSLYMSSRSTTCFPLHLMLTADRNELYCC